MSESLTLARKRGISEREHSEKRVDSTVKKGRFREGEKRKVMKASLGEVEGSMSGWVDAKALQDDLQSQKCGQMWPQEKWEWD